MRNFIVTLLALVLGCLIAPIIDPARVLALGELDVILGSICIFSVDSLWTFMSRKNLHSPRLQLLKFIANFTAFGLLWMPYTSSAAFDLVWLASLATGLLYAIWGKRNVFHRNGFE